MGVAIDIQQVTREFGAGDSAFTALGPVDLAFGDGEFVSVVGPSGCGKSTLMLLIAGLDQTSTGVIKVDGKQVSKALTEIGIAFQDHLLLDFRTAEENVLLQAAIRHLDKRESQERARDLLLRLGVGEAVERYPRQLSGGMRQRVAIARALIHEPPLLLMDEPFGALDAITRTQVRQDLEAVWSGTRSTVVFVTHSIEEAVSLSDRVIVLSPSPGRVVEDVRIDLERPRRLLTTADEAFRGYVDHLYQVFENLGVFAARTASDVDGDA